MTDIEWFTYAKIMVDRIARSAIDGIERNEEVAAYAERLLRRVRRPTILNRCQSIALCHLWRRRDHSLNRRSGSGNKHDWWADSAQEALHRLEHEGGWVQNREGRPIWAWRDGRPVCRPIYRDTP